MAELELFFDCGSPWDLHSGQDRLELVRQGLRERSA